MDERRRSPRTGTGRKEDPLPDSTVVGTLCVRGGEGGGDVKDSFLPWSLRFLHTWVSRSPRVGVGDIGPNGVFG